jgi:PAS domain S-box-containing protein
MNLATEAGAQALRLRTLQALGLPGQAEADPVLDGLVRVAAQALRCTAAAVHWIDAERQWLQAGVGMTWRQTAREHSLCRHAMAGAGLMEVSDAQADARFAHDPLVAADGPVRFYAGMPIGIDGQVLGTLCVIDRVPRTLSAAERGLLADLSRAVEHWLLGRREQRALQARERAYRQLTEQMPGVVYRLTLAEVPQLSFVSPRLHEFGHAPEAWRAEPASWWQAVHPEDRARVHARLTSAAAEPRPIDLDYRLCDGQGLWRQVRDRVCAVAAAGDDGGGDGAVVVQGMMFDVTAQQREQAWLRKVSAAVEQASEAIVITDLEACVEYVNDAALRASGHSRGDLMGRPADTLRGSSMPELLWPEIRTRVLGGRPWRGALHTRRKDGGLRLQAATVAPVRDDNQRVSHLLVITHDVTDKHRLRAELERWRERLDGLVAERTEAIERARAAAEAASKAKSTFLATMSHEIRTPMNGVIGAVELLQRSTLSQYQRELAGTVHDSAEALMTLIDGILDFSKIEAGHLDIERAPLDVRDLLEHTCDALKPLAVSRGVHLHLFVDPALPALLLGDALRLRQVVTNLLGNAIKFCAGLERAGRVAVRAWPLSAATFRISVGDNGIGLSRESQARLFQPFMQAENSTTRRYGGTGLGLAICHRLAVAMGGRIGVESQPDGGARFDVDLPLSARAGAPPPAHDLTGLVCHVAVAIDDWAADWAATLAAAGAYVTRWSALPPTSGAAWHEPDTVLLIDAALLDDAEPVPVPCVLLLQGRRRSPRVLSGQCVALDIDGMHGDMLLAAVALAAGRLNQEPTLPMPLDDGDAPPMAADTALAAAQGCLVLVAEDDETNRMVLERQFALLGVAAEFAHDGAAAWQQWRTCREAYGLLLTDLHMPGMDGLELTAAIRNDEAGAHRMPIVALTASAVRGEITHCKAAGMDDALGKPIQIGTLGAAVRHWLARGRAQRTPANDAHMPPALDFDANVLVRAVGRNADALAGIRSAYLRRSRQDLEETQQALERGDWAHAGAVAHRWKSASRSVGAITLAQRLQALERLCRDGGAQAGDMLPALQADLAAVERWLSEPTLS